MLRRNSIRRFFLRLMPLFCLAGVACQETKTKTDGGSAADVVPVDVNRGDAAGGDLARTDTFRNDVLGSDVHRGDARRVDGQRFDQHVPDIWSGVDVPGSDSNHPDAGGPDAGGPDAGGPDAGSPDVTGARPDAAGVDAGQGTLSQRYPGDEGLAADPAVLFFDNFENGWGRWTAPDNDTAHLFIENSSTTAHAGSRYLRSTVTVAQLENDQYISASPYITFGQRVPEVYMRFHVRFPAIAPNPHHWIRFSAGDESYWSSGLANTVPPGDRGFWFDFDISNDDIFNFYVYWYLMRSGRCNDGTAVPGCDGDQGSTYYYGNTFQPLNQTAYPRDQWFCIEIRARANTVGQSTGLLHFWVDDQPVGAFGPGYPDGTWLRDRFNVGGCHWSACTDPVPFEGFDFRSDSNVLFKRFFLDAYYERGSNNNKRQALIDRGLTPVDEQTIYYDDVVIATERIGCRQ